MNTDKKLARIAGILFIIATVASMIGVLGFTKPILDDPDYLAKLAASEDKVLIGSLFRIIAAFASAGIAIFLYPVLRRQNEGLSLGAVSFRVVEGVFYLIGVMVTLALLSLSQDFVRGSLGDASSFQVVGDSLLAIQDWTGDVFGVVAFVLGAFLYYIVFYQSKLIPRWLSIWGVVGLVPLLISVLLVMFSIIPPLGVVQGVMAAPIGLQELVLAVWLIVKGFNPSTIDSK